MQCIHEDVREYRTKVVIIGTGMQTFTCRVGVVPRLDCGVLIGRDCPTLAQKLQHTPSGEVSGVLGCQGEPGGEDGGGATSTKTRPRRLTREDPSLRFALKEAGDQPPLAMAKGPCFTLG